jgi:hypothetical protein
MSHPSQESARTGCYELRFEGLYCFGRSYAFPCDADGNVQVALLSEQARSNYQRVSASVGREFLAPVKRIQPRGH